MSEVGKIVSAEIKGDKVLITCTLADGGLTKNAILKGGTTHLFCSSGGWYPIGAGMAVSLNVTKKA